MEEDKLREAIISYGRIVLNKEGRKKLEDAVKAVKAIMYPFLSKSMNKAINWYYNILDTAGRDQFSVPKSQDDILTFYENPAEFTVLSEIL